MTRATIWLLALCVVCGLAVSTSSANPAFSRQNDLACAACHSAWPNLNGFGRAFKENGFRLEPGAAVPDHVQKYGEKMWLEKAPFLAGKLNLRPYDKTDGADRKFRVFHELELFLAGNASNDFSYFVTVEAEDEIVDADSHFEVFLDQAFVGWHPLQYANVVGGYGPIFAADPYNSLATGNRRITRSDKAPLTGTFGAGFGFDGATQFMTYYGRAKGLYYSASFGTGNDDPEGEDATDWLVRAAYDLPVLKGENWDSGLSFGAFYLDGTNKDTFGVGLDQGYSRTGIDFNIETGNFQAEGVWLDAEADLASGATVSNSAYFVEALYVFHRKNEPLFYPVLRWQSVESNNGLDTTDSYAALVGAYIRQNINVNLEYFAQTEVPGGGRTSSRVTLFFNIGI